MGVTQPTHTLVVTYDEDPDYPDYALECNTPDLCHGWLECGDERDGPSPDEALDMAGFDGEWEEEQEFHGVLHTWHWGPGWTIPYTAGCIVQYCDWEPPYDMPYKPRAGRYEVEIKWDDNPELLLLKPYKEEIDGVG